MSWRRKTLACCVGMAAIVLVGCKKSESTTAAVPAKPASAGVTQRPPFGFLDVPRENDTVASGFRAYGWALDDSGIAGVTASLDDGPPAAAALDQSFPGVREAYPTFPNSDKAGFGFGVPSAAAGPHLLIVTFTANDGGKTEIKRHIRIKS
jgi:hypothetical protein